MSHHHECRPIGTTRRWSRREEREKALARVSALVWGVGFTGVRGRGGGDSERLIKDGIFFWRKKQEKNSLSL